MDFITRFNFRPGPPGIKDDFRTFYPTCPPSGTDSPIITSNKLLLLLVSKVILLHH